MYYLALLLYQICAGKNYYTQTHIFDNISSTKLLLKFEVSVLICFYTDTYDIFTSCNSDNDLLSQSLLKWKN